MAKDLVIDEEQYKSISQFRPIKIKISKIANAYFEVLHYQNNKSEYHIESEEAYYDVNLKYIHYRTIADH